ncbi:MAG: hypothetical protein B7Z13_13320 [Caulobacterales bacterium 32-67-6]|nr:MAG: hypothetical protein B7Z13_13320 [Caulobacterales bacterium 32-67-6]
MTASEEADSPPRGKRLETQIIGVALLSTIIALLAAFSVYQWRNWRVDREALAHETLVMADALARSAHAHVVREEVAAVDRPSRRSGWTASRSAPSRWWSMVRTC